MKTLLHNFSKSFEIILITQKTSKSFLSDIRKALVLTLFVIIGVGLPDNCIASVNQIYITDSFKCYSGSDSSKKSDEIIRTKRLSINHSKTIYTVEIISLSGCLPANAKFFKKCGRANEHLINNKHVYTVGEFKTVEEAQRMRDDLRKKGYNDAFTVAFINENRVIVDEIGKGLCNK